MKRRPKTLLNRNPDANTKIAKTQKGFNPFDKPIFMAHLNLFPDLIRCDSKKNIHLIELKVTKGNKVNISPHQVSFATRHNSARVWMLIEKQSTDKNQCYLYRSNSVMKLAQLGMEEVQPDLIFDLAQDAETFLCWLKNSKKLDTLHELGVKTAQC